MSLVSDLIRTLLVALRKANISEEKISEVLMFYSLELDRLIEERET